MDKKNDLIVTFEEVADNLSNDIKSVTDIEDVADDRLKSDNLPDKIKSAIDAIDKIDEKIKSAVKQAEEAKKTADAAAEKEAGWSWAGKDKREAIEALQTAVQNQASALTNSVDANKELFENQKKMTEAFRYLFGLGVYNLAANRIVVRELELKLKHASEEELSELAQQEIKRVIKQLKAQEDVLKKLDLHDEIFREHKKKLEDVKKRFDESTSNTLSKIESSHSTLNNKILDLSAAFGEQNNQLKSLIDGLADELKVEFSDLKQGLVKQNDEHKLDIKNLNDGLTSKIISASKDLEESTEKRISYAYSAINPRIIDLEQYKETELSRRTIFDTLSYKIFIGIIAIAALICSLISLFCR